ncbi:MAG: four helix bundle protein, partial [Desulfobacterales bacterium]|nr:four helix bundle protein [Desulfobacterales bacterium]
NYKELNVWQKSSELCLKVYKITTIFPNEQRYGITSQIRRSAKKDTAEIERMLKALIKSLENKHLNP